MDSTTPYVKLKRIDLKRHAELNEKRVQDRIAEDSKLLGLGDLILRDRERIQPRAGRLDRLLQDADTKRRYEVELQLERLMKRTLFGRSSTGMSSESVIPNTITVPFSLQKILPADF